MTVSPLTMDEVMHDRTLDEGLPTDIGGYVIYYVAPEETGDSPVCAVCAESIEAEIKPNVVVEGRAPRCTLCGMSTEF